MMQLGSTPVSKVSPASQRLFRSKLLRIITMVAAVITVVVLAAVGWYFWQLTPVNGQDTPRMFTVKPGDTADAIADRLKTEQFVRDELATKIALRLSGKTNMIKAGKYTISGAESVQQIIAKLESGQADVNLLTIVPGESLAAIKQRFVQIGFDAEVVEVSFAAPYEHPLLASKPAEADLEGYLYPDTYEVDVSQSPEVVILKAFDNFYQKLVEAALEKNFNNNPLSLFEAITLASIIEKESGTPEDSPKIAQVFLKRLVADMPLGADATFVYAAKKLGVAPSVTLNSPYNTRQVVGLPPGPISNFTIEQLKAVASPAQTDYLYFVTADDNTTYYARTLPEHEANVEKYCGERCRL